MMRAALTAIVTVVGVLASLAGAQVQVYTRENPPPTPALEELALRTSVSRDGITWTFAQPARVGQFINGDWYVVGPVTVTAISPAPANGRNGSTLNIPPTNTRSGFDSRIQAGRYDASLRDDPPIAMAPWDVLVSTISVDVVGQIKCMLRPSDSTLSPVRTASVLTCLPAPVPPDAFRPSYCGRSQRIYLARNLRRELLPRLPHVSNMRTLSEFAGYFRRPWIDTLTYEYDFPIEYMAQYPRETLRAEGMASLLLMLDFTDAQKEPLLVYLVQYGIDLHGIVRAGHPGWYAHGGHGNGRKLPIVMAGILLGEDDMARVSAHFPYAAFSEDQQTMYDDGWTGANVVYAGHMGADGNPGNPGWGAYEHLQPRDWEGDCIGESYRRCCTSIGWVGVALAGRFLRAEPVWDHQAFFDYCDRWMTEDDTQHLAIILAQTGRDYSASWSRQRQVWDSFTQSMWNAYRWRLDDQEVVARHVFYNNSAFDGYDAAANEGDDDAIATDKTPLLPGQKATAVNYTGYDRGINGIMIDIAGVPGTPTAADFAFRVGNSPVVNEWTAAAAPASITLRRGDGDGGSDRITITWPDGAIRGAWLRVTVRATAATGLTAADVFYVGNAPGEIGNSPYDAVVDTLDELFTLARPDGLTLDDFVVLKQHFGQAVPAGRNGDYDGNGTVDLDDFAVLKNHFGTSVPVTNPFDHNRDGTVNAADGDVCASNSGGTAGQLRLVNSPF
ncbi:MAG: hypothetical protein GX591_01915 [Planctomycetes bacterium]|nr:hypothetical protein [Planctomycetota bacterium]